MRVIRAAFSAAAKGDSKRVEDVRSVLNRTVVEIEALAKPEAKS